MGKVVKITLLVGASFLVSSALYGSIFSGSAHHEMDAPLVIELDGLDRLDQLDRLDERIEARVLREVERAERDVERATREVEAALAELEDVEVHVEAPANLGAGSEQETFSWTGRVSAGDQVEIKGVNGPIVARATDGSEVEVRAVKTGRKQDPSTVTIDVVEHSGGVTLCAVYPGRGNRCEPGDGGEMSVRKNDVSVRFEVLVPAGVDFVGRTVNGDVEAQDLGGDAVVSTVNGDIDVSAAGSAAATTVNGSINAVMGSLSDADRLRFSTVNGSITLDVPRDISADLEADWVNGGIESDLPVELIGKFWPRSARATFGEGGPDLDVSTVNGRIRVKARS
jgi:hypothetical protein